MKQLQVISWRYNVLGLRQRHQLKWLLKPPRREQPLQMGVPLLRGLPLLKGLRVLRMGNSLNAFQISDLCILFRHLTYIMNAFLFQF